MYLKLRLSTTLASQAIQQMFFHAALYALRCLINVVVMLCYDYLVLCARNLALYIRWIYNCSIMYMKFQVIANIQLF